MISRSEIVDDGVAILFFLEHKVYEALAGLFY